MSWTKLLASKTVTPLPATKAELDKLRSLVARSLNDVATPGLSTDMRFILAYDDARTLSLMIVRAAGYRPKTFGGHYNTFVALEAADAAFAAPWVANASGGGSVAVQGSMSPSNCFVVEQEKVVPARPLKFVLRTMQSERFTLFLRFGELAEGDDASWSTYAEGTFLYADQGQLFERSFVLRLLQDENRLVSAWPTEELNGQRRREIMTLRPRSLTRWLTRRPRKLLPHRTHHIVRNFRTLKNGILRPELAGDRAA